MEGTHSYLTVVRPRCFSFLHKRKRRRGRCVQENVSDKRSNWQEAHLMGVRINSLTGGSSTRKISQEA